MAVILSLSLAAVAGRTAEAAAPARGTTSVGITIHVLPIAEISFPEGRDFTITVPDHRWWSGVTISPRFLPFVVRGNARASVTVRPDAFLQVGSRTWLGLAHPDAGPSARGHGNPPSGALGYDVMVHFPVSDQRHGLFTEVDDRGHYGLRDSLATLPLTRPAGTRELIADVARLDRRALGVIWLLSGPDWTANGRRAAPGIYRGVLEVTVTADER